MIYIYIRHLWNVNISSVAIVICSNVCPFISTTVSSTETDKFKKKSSVLEKDFRKDKDHEGRFIFSFVFLK